jgi:ferric-dicitrate binding protein FerR (iron transport regulator)
LIADTTYKESIKSALDKDAKQFMDLFELPETTPPDEAFEKIFQKVKVLKQRKQPRRVWFRVAAAFIGLLALSSLIYEHTADQLTPMVIAQTAIGEQKTILLPDGSVVSLNVASTLKYPKSFVGNVREVFLQGEAFFEVTKNTKQPFLVHTGNLATQVLGTSFNVNAYTKDVNVAVATGKVRVRATGEHTTLTSGEQAIYTHAIGSLKKTHVALDNITSWRKGLLTFEQTPLSEVLHTLERWYEVQFELADPKMATCLIRGTIAYGTLAEAMDLLAFVLNASYEYVDVDRIRLAGGLCDSGEPLERNESKKNSNHKI